MPKDCNIYKNFIHVVVLEVLTLYSLNWFKLAEKKWHEKIGNGEVILYKGKRKELIYKVVVLEKLHKEVSHTEFEINCLEDE